MARVRRSSRVVLSPAAVRRLYPETKGVRRTVLGRPVIRQVRGPSDLAGVPEWLTHSVMAGIADRCRVWLIRDEDSLDGVGLLITRK